MPCGLWGFENGASGDRSEGDAIVGGSAGREFAMEEHTIAIVGVPVGWAIARDGGRCRSSAKRDHCLALTTSRGKTHSGVVTGR